MNGKMPDPSTAGGGLSAGTGTNHERAGQSDNALKNVEKLNGESESLTAKAKTEEEDITHAYQTLQTVYHMVCETERSLKAATERADKTQADLRRRSEEARTAVALTKELSEKLIEGKPCPVCGSTRDDRPRSAHETFSPDTAVQEQLRRLKRAF